MCAQNYLICSSEGRVLVLPQLEMADFVDSSCKELTYLRSGCGEGEMREGKDGEGWENY